MQNSRILEQVTLLAHIIAMAFGVIGLLWVLPQLQSNPTILNAPTAMNVFTWGMEHGGVAYILLGALAISLYAIRVLGGRTWLAFALPALVFSLCSELLGTSTGFPFGAYSYLNGLGYKIAGLVPFTIPFSWFYMGLSCYLLARAGVELLPIPVGLRRMAAIILGATLLTAWDLALDPPMSQSAFPFWRFQEAGEFFGMPYRNLTGWFGTAIMFMSVGSLLRPASAFVLPRAQLTIPLIVYLVNFSFGAIITLVSLDPGFRTPIALSLLLGVLPAAICWWLADLGRKAVAAAPVLTPQHAAR